MITPIKNKHAIGHKNLAKPAGCRPDADWRGELSSRAASAVCGPSETRLARMSKSVSPPSDMKSPAEVIHGNIGIDLDTVFPIVI